MQNRNSIYSARYDKANTRSITIKVNKNTEPDVIQKLASVENVNGYIKGLIKEDINRNK